MPRLPGGTNVKIPATMTCSGALQAPTAIFTFHIGARRSAQLRQPEHGLHRRRPARRGPSARPTGPRRGRGGRSRRSIEGAANSAARKRATCPSPKCTCAPASLMMENGFAMPSTRPATASASASIPSTPLTSRVTSSLQSACSKWAWWGAMGLVARTARGRSFTS